MCGPTAIDGNIRPCDRAGFVLAQIAADNQLPTTDWAQNLDVGSIVRQHGDKAGNKPFVALELLRNQSANAEQISQQINAIERMLVAARLRHIAGTRWGTRRYLNMELLKELEKGEVAA